MHNCFFTLESEWIKGGKTWKNEENGGSDGGGFNDENDDDDNDDDNDGKVDYTYDILEMVKAMIIAVQFDLYVGDSAEHDDWGGGWSVAQNYMK
jgi:hypothetical protein